MTDAKQSGNEQCAIGIDVGGTKCAAGLVLFPEGRILARRWQPTLADRGGEAVLADVVEMTRSLRREAENLHVHPVAVGVGVAELVSVDGRVLSNATIRWKDLDVAGAVSAQVGLPAVLEADVRAAARAEATLGAGRKFESFLFITIGTGISASFVLDGVPHAGARGLTGTFASGRGMIPGDKGELFTGPPLEEFAGGPALENRLRILRPDFVGSAAEVLAQADGGDALAKSVVDSAARAVGAAVAHLVNVLDPDAVIIGGGLGTPAGRYRDELVVSMRAHIWSDEHRDLPVRSAELGNDAGFIGAAISALVR